MKLPSLRAGVWSGGHARRIAVTGPGREKPALLLSNQMDEPASRLVDRYARRMVIENTIADAIDFLHMDTLSAAALLFIGLDVRLALIEQPLRNPPTLLFGWFRPCGALCLV